MGRILGIDNGDKRIGIALSDPTRTIATAHTTIEEESIKKRIATILQIAHENQADQIVIGLPLNMDGTTGPSALKAKDLATRISRQPGAPPVALYDERMSTLIATRTLHETRTKRKHHKKTIDKLAAQVILQNYLDNLPPTPNNPETPYDI